MIDHPHGRPPCPRPFDREGWFFELKWDGFRAIAEGSAWFNDSFLAFSEANSSAFFVELENGIAKPQIGL